MQNHKLPTAGECQQVEAAKRSSEGFRALYRQYQPRLFAYVAYRVGGKQDAEDVVAEVFRRVVTALPRFDCRHDGAFSAWLFRIARNECARYYAAYARDEMLALDDLPDLQSDLPSVEHLIQSGEMFAYLRRLIGQLSERRQEIITLRFLGELSNREIAQALGLDERTVASHLCRAIEDLSRFHQVEQWRLKKKHEIE